MKIIEEQGYNLMSLSKESNVPYTTIRSMIERNLTNASVDNMIKICNVLDITIESLYNDKLIKKDVIVNKDLLTKDEVKYLQMQLELYRKL